MGGFIGLPPSLIETYGSDIKKVYKANGVPIYLGLVTMFLSAFVHLMITCVVIVLLAPILFEATLSTQLSFLFLALAIYITSSLSIGSVLGLTIKNQAKLTMIAQLVFLPSIMLSGIMFPIKFLPDFLETIGLIFPASWGYQLMLDNGFCFKNLWYLIFIFFAAVIVCGIVLKKQKAIKMKDRKSSSILHNCDFAIVNTTLTITDIKVRNISTMTNRTLNIHGVNSRMGII